MCGCIQRRRWEGERKVEVLSDIDFDFDFAFFFNFWIIIEKKYF